MPITDIFKKKEQRVEKNGIKKPIEKELKKEEIVKEEMPKKTKIFKKRKPSGISLRILDSTHVTEKATELVKQRCYVFNVSPRSNKTEIKRAVEETYGVNIEAVRIIKVHGRKRRLGKHEGWKSGYKKAIVKLVKGQEIEVLPK